MTMTNDENYKIYQIMYWYKNSIHIYEYTTTKIIHIVDINN